VRKLAAAIAATAIAGLPLVSSAVPSQAATPTCFGKPATIVGSAGPDTLVGQGGVSDVIFGGGGNDYISGGDFYGGDAIPGNAPDLLCGGPGDDRVTGSPGNDKLNGGDGNDYVDGGNGADLEQGNAGNDTVGKGSFADADSANDVMHGNGGNDVLNGGWGKDKLYGDAGADQLYDEECDGPTLLNGGAGDDYMESWSSSFDGWHGNVCNSVADQVVGDIGIDTAQVDRLDSVTTVEHVTRITQPGN
jgi:Ca2+-binding RTX toxin-like protein